jgi:hypothetical protein
VDVSEVTNYIIRYEEEGLSEEDTIKLFQYLVDSGMAWRLQGFYGRQAMALIDMGLVTRPDAETPSGASLVVQEEPNRKRKSRRGRPSTKQVGALVQMGQRRNPGQGIILDRIEDRPYEGHSNYSAYMEHMKTKGYVDYHTAGTEHQNFVLVHWFDPPSDYTSDRNYHDKQWYPDKWVKVVSPVKK